MKEDNFVIKYKNKLHYFNAKKINNSHIVTSENKKEFLNIGALFGKKLLIDFKKFNGFIQKNKKMIEITSIITTGNKYMIKDSSIDIIKLVKSALYTSINKHLIDKSVVDTITDTKTLNKEIKKLDKAFIETGSRQKDKEFYCSMSNIKLQHIGDKLTVKDFMKLSKSDSKKAVKIILNVPYFSLSLNEKQILLPRNILLELISIEDNKYTVVAKAKKQEQFKLVKDSSIKADLYDIVGSTKVTSLISSKPQKLRKLIKGGNWFETVETVKSVLTRLRARMKSRNNNKNRINPSEVFDDLSREASNMLLIDSLHRQIEQQDRQIVQQAEDELGQATKIKKLEETVKKNELLTGKPLTYEEFNAQTAKYNKYFKKSLKGVNLSLYPDELKDFKKAFSYDDDGDGKKQRIKYLAGTINELLYTNINSFFDIIQLLLSEETSYGTTIDLYCSLLETRNKLYNIRKAEMLENIFVHSNLILTEAQKPEFEIQFEIDRTTNKIYSFIIDINNKIILFLQTFKKIALLYSKVGDVMLVNEHKQALTKLQGMIDISFVNLQKLKPHLTQILGDVEKRMEEPLKYRFNEVLVINLLEHKFPKHSSHSSIDITPNGEFNKTIVEYFKFRYFKLTTLKININPILSDLYNNKKKAILDKKALLPKIPNQYLCPITKDIMQDPVVTSDGNTYEREYIESWLLFHDKSPMTNETLPHKNLTPNIALKTLITDFKENESKYTPLESSIKISKILDVSLNEQYVVYMTDPQTAAKILANGFDDIMKKTTQIECFYFTNTTPIFDNKYNDNTTLTFILARVLMGNAHILEGNEEISKQNIPDYTGSTIYDSVFNKTAKDNITTEEYVVYNSDQIYPEYIFTLNNIPDLSRRDIDRDGARYRATNMGDRVRARAIAIADDRISTSNIASTSTRDIDSASARARARDSVRARTRTSGGDPLQLPLQLPLPQTKQPTKQPIEQPIEKAPEQPIETPIEYNHTALDDYEYNKNMNEYTKYWFSKDNIEIYNRSLAKLIPSYNSEDLILLYKLEAIILYGLENLLEPEPP